jgi:hypothetical protein
MEFISFLISSHERHHERAAHRILLLRRLFLHQALGGVDRAIYFFSAFASAVVSDQVLSGLYSLMAAAVVAVFFPRSF